MGSGLFLDIDVKVLRELEKGHQLGVPLLQTLHFALAVSGAVTGRCEIPSASCNY